MTHDFENVQLKITAFPLRFCGNSVFSIGIQNHSGNHYFSRKFGAFSSILEISVIFQNLSGNEMNNENIFENFVKNDR